MEMFKKEGQVRGCGWQGVDMFKKEGQEIIIVDTSGRSAPPPPPSAAQPPRLCRSLRRRGGLCARLVGGEACAWLRTGEACAWLRTGEACARLRTGEACARLRTAAGRWQAGAGRGSRVQAELRISHRRQGFGRRGWRAGADGGAGRQAQAGGVAL